MGVRNLRVSGWVAAITIAGGCSPAAQLPDARSVPILTRPAAARIVQTHVAGIDINCHGGADKVTITLDKWKVRAGPGDAITFKMNGSHNAADYYQVTWKRPDAQWPLDSVLYTIPSGGSRTARVRANAVNGAFPYNINFYCEGGNPAQVYTGVIDPDIIISGGTTRDTTQN